MKNNGDYFVSTDEEAHEVMLIGKISLIAAVVCVGVISYFIIH